MGGSVPHLEQHVIEALLYVSGWESQPGKMVPADKMDRPRALVELGGHDYELGQLEDDAAALVQQNLLFLFVERYVAVLRYGEGVRDGADLHPGYGHQEL